ncbi:MAG TPA: hypothetical protein VEO56_07595 [Bacteroidota bacterium]|nr:hypothetical protein [Bacteroidota bacterium]
MTELSGWGNFYAIVGSAAGALIGLQFVVLTLIADMANARDFAQAGSAFTTPSVVHFAAVLLLSAISSAPWNEFDALAVCWGVIGLLGFLYTVVVARRMRRQRIYQPVFEDWAFHMIFPLAAYAILIVSACTAQSHARVDLFLVGAAALMLLFIGIHNAWDLVTYNLFSRRRDQQEGDQAP